MGSSTTTSGRRKTCSTRSSGERGRECSRRSRRSSAASCRRGSSSPRWRASSSAPGRPIPTSCACSSAKSPAARSSAARWTRSSTRSRRSSGSSRAARQRGELRAGARRPLRSLDPLRRARGDPHRLGLRTAAGGRGRGGGGRANRRRAPLLGLGGGISRGGLTRQSRSIDSSVNLNSVPDRFESRITAGMTPPLVLTPATLDLQSLRPPVCGPAEWPGLRPGAEAVREPHARLPFIAIGRIR